MTEKFYFSTGVYDVAAQMAGRDSGRGTITGSIDLEGIVNRARNPPLLGSVLDWLVPTIIQDASLNYRKSDVAMSADLGLLIFDIDKDNHDAASVWRAVRKVVGANCYILMHSTKSSKEYDKRWRVIIPYLDPFPAAAHKAMYRAVAELTATEGVTLDMSLESVNQFIFLPVRGEHYEVWEDGAGFFEFDIHSQLVHRSREIFNQIEIVGDHDAKKSFIFEFRRHHDKDLYTMLTRFGYEPRSSGSLHWRSPYQQSYPKSYATKIWPDGGMTTLSDSDRAVKGLASSGGKLDCFALAHHFLRIDHEDMVDYCRSLTYLDLPPVDFRADAVADDIRDRAAGFRLWSASLPDWFEGSPRYAGGTPVNDNARSLVVTEAIGIAEKVRNSDEPHIRPASAQWDNPFPPGLVGEVAQYINRSSESPIKQFSIAMSLYTIAALAGAKYKVDKDGLNLFMMVAGQTGSGKGASLAAAQRLVGELGRVMQKPAEVAEIFFNDPVASAQGLRQLVNGHNQSRGVYQEDADSWLNSVIYAQPGTLHDALRTEYTKYWSSSSEDKIIGAKHYAKSVDRLEIITSPAVTLGLDLQLEPFRRFLGAGNLLTTGFAARFIFVAYEGKISQISGQSPDISIPDGLIPRLKELWDKVKHFDTQGESIDVAWENDGLRQEARLERNVFIQMQNDNRPHAELMSRQALNAKRVAGLLAVGSNPHAPVITREMWEWSRSFVNRGYDMCLAWASNGQIGSGESVRVAKMKQAIHDYFSTKQATLLTTYKVPRMLLDHKEALKAVVAETYLIKKLKDTQDFKGIDVGKNSSEQNVRNTIDEMIAQDYLSVVDINYLRSIFPGFGLRATKPLNQRLFMLGDAFS